MLMNCDVVENEFSAGTFFGRSVGLLICLCDQCVIQSSFKAKLKCKHSRNKFVENSFHWYASISSIDFEWGRQQQQQRRRRRRQRKVFIVEYSLANVRTAIEKRIIIQNFPGEIFLSFPFLETGRGSVCVERFVEVHIGPKLCKCRDNSPIQMIEILNMVSVSPFLYFKNTEWLSYFFHFTR